MLLKPKKVKLPAIKVQLPPPSGTAVPTPEARLADWLDFGFAFMGLDPGSSHSVAAVIFDLDGVLVDTAEFHYQAWQRLADELKIPFNRQANEAFRGVGRMECMNKLLGSHATAFATEEKKLLAERKNNYYLALIENLTPNDLLPGARELINALRGINLKLGLVSASRNVHRVLKLLDIADEFDVIIDGNRTSHSKPHPEGFLLAAAEMKVPPSRCIVLEDATAGVIAAHAAGMKTIALAQPTSSAQLSELADSITTSLLQIHIEDLNKLVA